MILLQADSTSSAATTSNDSALSLPSWRTNLRKTGSTSMVPEWMADNESNSLPRSASSPRLALDSRLEIVSLGSYFFTNDQDGIVGSGF